MIRNSALATLSLLNINCSSPKIEPEVGLNMDKVVYLEVNDTNLNYSNIRVYRKIDGELQLEDNPYMHYRYGYIIEEYPSRHIKLELTHPCVNGKSDTYILFGREKWDTIHTVYDIESSCMLKKNVFINEKLVWVDTIDCRDKIIKDIFAR